MGLVHGVTLVMILGSAVFSYFSHQSNKYDGTLLIERYRAKTQIVALKEKLHVCYFRSVQKSPDLLNAKTELQENLKNISLAQNAVDIKLKREFLNVKEDVANYLKDSKQSKDYKNINIGLDNLERNIQKDIENQELQSGKKSSLSSITIFARMAGLLAIQFVLWRWLVQVRQRHQSEEEEQRDTTAKLTIMAEVDPLTGLRNRRTFEHHLTFEFERSQQQRWPLSLIMVDVDHFKKFNDAFGHLQGDEALKTAALVLLQAARKSDIVVRYGGEEFAMLLPHTGIEEAKAIGERLREIMHATEWPNRACTASIGVASLTPDMEDPATLIEYADNALYRAKEQGRDCVVHASEMGIRKAA
jgi:diguanylate cyclase (GGDEF)-like protein